MQGVLDEIDVIMMTHVTNSVTGLLQIPFDRFRYIRRMKLISSNSAPKPTAVATRRSPRSIVTQIQLPPSDDGADTDAITQRGHAIVGEK